MRQAVRGGTGGTQVGGRSGRRRRSQGVRHSWAADLFRTGVEPVELRGGGQWGGGRSPSPSDHPGSAQAADEREQAGQRGRHCQSPLIALLI